MNILLDIFVPILIGACCYLIAQLIFLNLRRQKDLDTRRREREKSESSQEPSREPLELLEWSQEAHTDYIVRTNRGTYRGWAAWWYDTETAHEPPFDVREDLRRIFRQIEWGWHRDKRTLERIHVEVVNQRPTAGLRILGPKKPHSDPEDGAA